MSFADLCWFRATSAGTGGFVPASAITGYLVPADVLDPPMADGAAYSYVAQSDDESQKAYGSGTWDAGSDTLVRAASENFIGAGFAGDFTAPPKVMLTPLARDIGRIEIDVTADIDGNFNVPDIIGNCVLRLLTNGLGMDHSILWGSVAVGAILEIEAAINDPADLFRVNDVIYNGLLLEIHMSSTGDVGALADTEEGWIVWLQTPQAGAVLKENNGAGFECSFEHIGVGVQGRQIATFNASDDGFETSLIAPELRLKTEAGCGAINGSLKGYGAWGTSPIGGIVVYYNQADPASISLDPSNFVLPDGSTPASVIFDTVDQSMALLPATDAIWVIMYSTPGVVTP